jgi:Transposase DDE domain
VFDKSQRTDGAFSRSDFADDPACVLYICPGSRAVRPRQTAYRTTSPRDDEDGMVRYRASKFDCDACALKPRCCPKEPARKIMRSIHEGARDRARDILATEAGQTSRRQREKVEMPFAHIKPILKLDRLRSRGPNGTCDEFCLAAAAQNLRKCAKLLTGPMLKPA